MTGAPERGLERAGEVGGSELAVGVDVGGTKIVGGLVDRAGQVLAQTRADTPAQDATRTRGVIVDLVRELAAAHPVTAAGIGAAGWVDAAGERIRFAPHLAWRDEPLRDQLAAATGLPVMLDNDANAAAWAEHRFGAGAGTRSMVLVAVGTGIGCGIVLAGGLVRGAYGFAGEPGHQQAVPDGLPCPCGRTGCLEQYASGTALVRLARVGARADPAAAPVLRELAADLDLLTGPTVTTAARAGDKVARDAFDQVGRWLGTGLAGLVQVLDPEVLVVGGGVAEAGELLLAPTRDAYQRALGQRARLPVAPVRAARLGAIAGVVGAADLARALR